MIDNGHIRPVWPSERVPAHHCHIHWVPHVRSKFQKQSFSEIEYRQGILDWYQLALRATGMEALIVLSDPNNMAGILINNLIKEEDIARQRSPLDSKMYAKMLGRSNDLVHWIRNMVATLVLA